MKCQPCGAEWPTPVDVYETPSAKVALCNSCLWADMPTRERVVAVFTPGSQFYVAPDGSESPMPSYAS